MHAMQDWQCHQCCSHLHRNGNGGNCTDLGSHRHQYRQGQPCSPQSVHYRHCHRPGWAALPALPSKQEIKKKSGKWCKPWMGQALLMEATHVLWEWAGAKMQPVSCSLCSQITWALEMEFTCVLNLLDFSFKGGREDKGVHDLTKILN